MKLSITPGMVLIVACAVSTPLLVAGVFSFLPPAWTSTTIGLALVFFALYGIVVGVFTTVCMNVIATYGLHQILVFSITALIVSRVKQLLLSTPNEVGIVEAATLLIVCLIVFCVTYFMQRNKKG